MLPRPLVRLYRTVSPSPLARPARACKSGCLFSVALVVAPDGSLPTLRTRPAVSRLAALRCSDFPLPGLPLRATNGQRPSHPLPRSQKAETGRRPQKTGGGGGIRTLDTVSRIQHFQCCAFSHSATPPTTNPTATAELTRISACQPTRHPKWTGRIQVPRPARDYPAGPAKLAVRVGFEPTVQLPVHRFSRPTDSATLAPHQKTFSNILQGPTAPRRCRKKSRSRAPHASARTPPVTSRRWLSTSVVHSPK